MKIELLWYNPVEKEYQIGDRASYKSLMNNSNEPENFIIFEKFCNMNTRLRNKIVSKIAMLNSYRKSTTLAF